MPVEGALFMAFFIKQKVAFKGFHRVFAKKRRFWAAPEIEKECLILFFLLFPSKIILTNAIDGILNKGK